MNADTKPECNVCHKPVGRNPLYAHLIDGGTRYAKPGEVEPNPNADVGWHPIGSECAKRLRLAGVELVKWNEMSEA
jgi:hypothetical protein